MADKWQIDINRKMASLGNFVVRLHRTNDHCFAIEVSNVPALREDQVLALAGEAAAALSQALQQDRPANAEV